MALTIVTGSDNAGYGHKSALKELLEQDPRVEKVIDVGVTGREDGTYYPNVAVEAAEKIAAGEADRALLVCGTGLGVAIAPRLAVQSHGPDVKVVSIRGNPAPRRIVLSQLPERVPSPAVLSLVRAFRKIASAKEWRN